MRWVLLATAVAASIMASVGCGKRINPTWCQQPENQSNGECGNIADAKSQQSMACTDDPYCASSTPNTPWCNKSDGVCVECNLGSQCPADRPACTQNTCGACTQNSDCIDTNYCTGGVCAKPDDSVTASPTGTSTGACTVASPCDLVTGVNRAIAEGKILRLVPAGSNKQFNLAATLDLHGNIRVTGENTVIDGQGADPAIRISSGMVTFDTIAIQNAPGAAIACVGGSLDAKRLFIQAGKDNHTDAAITSTSACQLSLDESVIYLNKHGGLAVTSSSDAPYNIHNTVIANNTGAPAVALNGPGQFAYNTVVDNHGTASTGGVTCAGGPSLDMNIIGDNELDVATVDAPPPPPADAAPPPPPQQVGCDMGIVHGFTGYRVDFQFQGGTNAFTKWHLTPQTLLSQGSPTSVVNIPNVECNNPASPVHDIDGTARPAHSRCDMGADECDLCYQTSNGHGNN